MRTAGIILIVLGILGFAVTGVSLTIDDEVADLGPLSIENQEERSVTIPPLVAGGAVVVGIGLVVADNRRTTEGSN